jgi:hypothetical protein
MSDSFNAERVVVVTPVLRAKPLPPLAEPGVVPGGHTFADSLVSDVLLGLLLAASAALIPGEAGTVLETPLTWSDVLETTRSWVRGA